MSTVLIAGGAGYVGSHAVHAFLDSGYEVVVIDDLTTGVRANLPPAVTFYEGDIADRNLVARIGLTHPLEGAVHFAGSTIVQDSIADPAKYYRNNTSRGLELVDALVSVGVRHLLFSSTAAVYGMPHTVAVAETAPLKPVNPYGWSKLHFEQQLRDLTTAHGLTVGILRVFNVAGADPNGRTGQRTSQPTHLVQVACQVATGRRSVLSIFGTDYPTRDGTCIRDYIHVSDLALAHVAVYKLLHATGRSYTLNCGNGLGYSVREVVDTVDRVVGGRLPLRFEARRVGDPPQLVADPSLLIKLTAWRPRYTLTDMVETALQWEHREKTR